MTNQDISALLDRHLSDWLGSGPDSPCLRERMADAIREAVAAQDKLWADGNATLRHERDAAIAHAERARSEYENMNAAYQQLAEQHAELAAWKESALAVEASWDCQAVGKLLGLPLGSDIRAGIEPGIRALLARLP